MKEVKSPNFIVGNKAKNNDDVVNFSNGGVSLRKNNTLNDFITEDLLKLDIAAYSTEVLGIPSLRAEVANMHKNYFVNDISENNVVVSEGANRVISIVLEIIARENRTDEAGVIIFSPYFYNTYTNIERVGLRVYEISRSVDNSFRLDIEDVRHQIDAVGKDKIKAIYFVNPDNPVGVFYNDSIVDELAKLCEEKGIYLILDTSFDGINLSENICTTHQYNLNENTVLVSGLSKGFAVAGIRVGFGILPTKFIEKYGNIQDTDGIHHGTLDQTIAVQVIKNRQERLSYVKDEMHERYLKMTDLLKTSRAVKSFTGEYWIAWVQLDMEYLKQKFHDISESNIGDYVLDNFNIALVSGDNFGSECGDFIRIGYGIEKYEKFSDGLERLRNFLN